MEKQGVVAVLGLGYVGLPLAREASSAGWRVVGIDTDQLVVKTLMRGLSHVDDVTQSDVEEMLANGFVASHDRAEISGVEVIVICVPTPLSAEGGPDLGAVMTAGSSIAEHLRAGQTVILESTTYPGTTEEVLIPILEGSGLTAGVDFFVAFSPERIDPGNPTFGVRNTPKVVGGLTPECTKRAVRFYETFVDSTITAKGLKEAEMTKLLENTYRHSNIALVNEMAQFCHLLDIDLWDAIRCASSKPFGFQAFFPGPGVGGHCIPIDPNYLSHRVRTHLGQPFRFVELAQEINSSMPSYVARRAQDILNSAGKALKGSRVLLIGVTYKPDLSDQRETPAVPIAAVLRGLGADIAYLDPYVPEWAPLGTPVPRERDLERALSDCDLAVILQNHASLDFTPILLSNTRTLDTRGILNGPNVERL